MTVTRADWFSSFSLLEEEAPFQTLSVESGTGGDGPGVGDGDGDGDGASTSAMMLVNAHRFSCSQTGQNFQAMAILCLFFNKLEPPGAKFRKNSFDLLYKFFLFV